MEKEGRRIDRQIDRWIDRQVKRVKGDFIQKEIDEDINRLVDIC